MVSQLLNNSNPVDSVSSVVTGSELQGLITGLRGVVDTQLDQLINAGVSAPETVHSLARLEGLLDIFGAYAESWRPSDVLRALNTDLEKFNDQTSAAFNAPSLGAYLKPRASTTALDETGVRLEPTPERKPQPTKERSPSSHGMAL